jgi:hypothetical protein
MPVVTPFGSLILGDPVGLSRWASAHAARHKQLVAEHIGPTGGNLDEPIDGDWMLRHGARHVALATAVMQLPGTNPQPAALSSADTKVLILPDIWQTDKELQDWHDLHNRLHQLIDAQRAIATHQAKPNQPLPGLPPQTIFPTRPGVIGGPAHPPWPGRPGPQP